MNIKTFLITSSLPVFGITLLYLAKAFKQSNRPSDIPYELFAIFIPLLYGIFGVINHYIINKYGINYSIIVGILFGLLLSSIGRFQLGLPIKIFGFTEENDYLVHIYAAIIYALVFRFIVTPITIEYA